MFFYLGKYFKIYYNYKLFYIYISLLISFEGIVSRLQNVSSCWPYNVIHLFKKIRSIIKVNNEELWINCEGHVIWLKESDGFYYLIRRHVRKTIVVQIKVIYTYTRKQWLYGILGDHSYFSVDITLLSKVFCKIRSLILKKNFVCKIFITMFFLFTGKEEVDLE